MSENNELISIKDFGILGSNYYFSNLSKNYGLSSKDIFDLDLTEEVFIHQSLLGEIIKINNDLKRYGFALYIKEGYRSKKVYEKIYQLRKDKFGEKETNKLLNMKDMPHGTGLSIDVTLFDLKNNKILILHKKKDGVDGFLRTFYENKDNEISYYRNVLETIMYKYGFKNLNHEYFHFNFIKI